jgi:tetratricopeptide (TPR) repeat protein
VSEPESRPRGRAKKWLAALSVSGAAGLTIWALSEGPGNDTTAGDCEGVGAAMDTVWTDATSSEIATAFEQVELPYASTMATSVVRDIDDYVEDWQSARRSICESDDSPERKAARSACLQRQREQLQGFIDGLRDADAALVEDAGFVTRWLPPLEDCGNLVAQSGTPDDAHTLDALAAQVALGHGERAAAQLATLVDAPGEGPDPKRARALLLGGLVHLQAERWDDAAKLLEQAVWGAIESGHDPWAIEAALALSIASAHSRGEVTSAQRWWRLASALTTKLGPGLERQRRLLLTQAELLMLQGQWEAALAVYEPGLSVTEKRLGAEHPAMVPGLAAAAECAARLERAPESLHLHDRARKIVESSFGRSHPLYHELPIHHGLVLLDVGRPDLAGPELQRGLEGFKGPVTRLEVEAALGLGRAAAAEREPGAAEEAFALAEKLHEQAGLPPSVLMPSIHLGRGLVHLERNDARAALESFNAALALHEAGEGDSIEVAETSVRIGRALALLGRMEEAGKALERAAKVAARVYGESDPRTAEIWLAQSEVSADAGDPATALDQARRALAVLAAARGPTDVSTLVALTQIGSTCLALDRDSDAVAAFEQAVAVAKAGDSPGQLASAQLGLATALWKAGDQDGSLAVVAELRKSIEASDGNSPVTQTDVESWMQRRGVSM